MPFNGDCVSGTYLVQRACLGKRTLSKTGSSERNQAARSYRKAAGDALASEQMSRAYRDP